jgi:GlpG protein
MTKFLIAFCSVIFLWTFVQERQNRNEVPEIVQICLFEYPGSDWAGFYGELVSWAEHKEIVTPELFRNIREGQVWRLVTPAFLHTDLIHLLFNMLWLLVLGRMMEKNLKLYDYIFFILIAAVVTNTLQYLMTGPFFMGFSGIASAMAGYIWVRKRRAPWESYPIDNGTLIFLGIFILGMLVLQIVAFFLNILHIVPFQLNIANTAHVSGALLGMLLGRIEVFQRNV